MKFDPGWLWTAFTSALSNAMDASWLFSGSVGVSFMLLVWGAMTLTTMRGDPLRRRLGALRDDHVTAIARPSLLARGLALIRPYLEPRKEEQRRSLREKLQQAGLESELALTLLVSSKILAAVMLPAAVGAASPMIQSLRTDNLKLLLMMGIAIFVGWLLPNIYLDRRVEARKSRLIQSLPDALDLLVACTEAGLGLNAAIERVAEQLPDAHTELRAELRLVNAQVRAGVDRTIALRNLAERTGLDDIRGLVALIAHSMRFGTGIADTLRIYADEFRDRRMQRAEEQAALVGTKLIFPLCFCIFPAFFVVAVGPAVLGVLRAVGR